MSGRSESHRALVDELVRRSDELVELIVDGAAGAVPGRWSDATREECRPHVETLLPLFLAHLRSGTRPDAAELAGLEAASRARGRTGRPLGVALAAVTGAIGRFGTAVVQAAGVGRAGAIVSVLSDAAAITHDVVRALHAGREPVAHPVVRPDWIGAVPPERRIVVQLAAEGRSTAQIARQTGYSVQAVSAHLAALMRVTGAANRNALVAQAVRHGLVRLGDDDPEWDLDAVG